MIPTPTEIEHELHREIAARAATYPRMIEQARMTSAQAAEEQRLAQAWLLDWQRRAAWLALPIPRPLPQQQTHTLGFSWHDRITGVQRELDRRTRLYPGWIAKGQLREDEAARRTARLKALHQLYEEGWDWYDSFGRRPDFRTEPQTPEIRETNRVWLDYVIETMERRAGVAPQQELVL